MLRYSSAVEEQMQVFYGSLREKDRRRYAAVEAEKLGFGGVEYISQLLRCDPKTIRQGRADLADLPDVPPEQVRKKGGRKCCLDSMPGLQAAFIEVVAPHTAGSPMDENVRWTRLSRLEIAEELAERDFPVGLRVVAELLETEGYVKRQAEKSLAMGQSPHRNEQFENIARLTAKFRRAGLPVISMDTKKKELVGNFYRAGRLYATAPIRTFDHDFRTAATGLVIPHGLYDVVRNVGHITLGISHDTSAFACDSLAAWWFRWGRRAYPDADALLLLCDCGGSNSATQYLFKADLERLAERLKLTIRVAHYPPYTSKYNPIEHRFFPHVTRACQGVVFNSLETVRNLMAETHTLSGLTTTVAVLEKDYPTQRRVDADYKSTMNIRFDKRLPKWNYQAQWN